MRLFFFRHFRFHAFRSPQKGSYFERRATAGAVVFGARQTCLTGKSMDWLQLEPTEEGSAQPYAPRNQFPNVRSLPNLHQPGSVQFEGCVHRYYRVWGYLSRER